LADSPVETEKVQFFTKNRILYRKYTGRQDNENKIQLVVPENLREKVVSLVHDILHSVHRGS